MILPLVEALCSVAGLYVTWLLLRVPRPEKVRAPALAGARITVDCKPSDYVGYV